MGSVYFVQLRSKNTTSAFDIAEELSDKYEYVYEADGEDIVDPYAAGYPVVTVGIVQIKCPSEVVSV